MKATAENFRREIREKAEKAVREKTERLRELSKEDVERFVHELVVRQTELEIQNEEHRQAGEALEASRRWYAELYEYSGAGYFTLDKDGIILDLNRTGATLLDREKSSLLETSFSLYVEGEADRARFRHLLREAFMQRTGKAIDVKLRKRDGTTVETRLQFVLARQLFVEAGCCWVMLIDITERKQLEEALRQSKENYRILFDKSPLAKWVLDLETFSFLEVNEAAIQHYGYNWEEFRDLTLADISSEEEFNRFRHAVEETRSKGMRLEGQFQTKHRKKNKEIIDVDIRYTEIVYSGRKAVLAAIVDITGRKRAEQELRESEQRFRAIFDNAAMGIVEVNAEERFIGANNRACEILGFAPHELIGMSVHDLTAPEDRATSDRLNAELREGRHSILDYEKRYLRRDGSRVWIHVTVSPIREPGSNRFVRAIGTLEEISGRKRSEEELKRTMEELERSNRELQQFAYVASHDLQEPLRTVSSYVDLLAMKYKGKIDPSADKYISFAVEGANRMSELINDLLAFSRVATKGNPFVMINAGEALERALGNLRKSIKESSTVITRGEMPEVVADPSQLTQLFQNLIANAVEFRKKGVKPHIHISAERQPREWVFGVQDNGIGIEPRFYERIFTIFQRLHTREEYPGTGVGLAICKRIVERHGGRIWVESKPEEGSMFYFTLPVSG